MRVWGWASCFATWSPNWPVAASGHSSHLNPSFRYDRFHQINSHQLGRFCIAPQSVVTNECAVLALARHAPILVTVNEGQVVVNKN